MTWRRGLTVGLSVIFLIVIAIISTSLVVSNRRQEAVSMEVKETERSGGEEESAAPKDNEAEEITGHGPEKTKEDYYELYDQYLRDVLIPTFQKADDSPFVLMYHFATCDSSDFTTGLATDHFGIWDVAYADLDGDGIDELIVFVAKRMSNPEFHEDIFNYSNSYYSYDDALLTYVYSIKDSQVVPGMSERDTEATDIAGYLNCPLNANCKFLRINRENKDYILIINCAHFIGDDLGYVLIGEEDGKIQCLANRQYSDGYIWDGISKEEVETPELVMETYLDEAFCDIYMTPLYEHGIEIPALRTYFAGIYAEEQQLRTYATEEYPYADDYPEDAEILMEIRVEDAEDLVEDMSDIMSAYPTRNGYLNGFKCFTVMKGQSVQNRLIQTDWNNVIDVYLAENPIRTILPGDRIEDEVKRIRQVWNEDRAWVQTEHFDMVESEKGIRKYYEEDELCMIEVDRDIMDGYSRIYQIEGGELTFAYYESASEQIRLYFYKGSLFRWIQTSADGTAVTYDNEWTNEMFLQNESMAMNDVKKIASIEM